MNKQMLFGRWVLGVTLLGLAACGHEPQMSQAESVNDQAFADDHDFGEGLVSEQSAELISMRLDWSSEKESLQRKLFDTIHHINSGWLEIFVPEVMIEDGLERILCESDGERYACELTLSAESLPFESNSQGLSALLHDGILERFPESRKGSYVELMHGEKSVRCDAKTLGMVQVMSYSCDFKLQDSEDDPVLPL